MEKKPLVLSNSEKTMKSWSKIFAQAVIWENILEADVQNNKITKKNTWYTSYFRDDITLGKSVNSHFAGLLVKIKWDHQYKAAPSTVSALD